MSKEQDTAMYDQPDDEQLNADAEREAEFWRTHPRDDAGADAFDVIDDLQRIHDKTAAAGALTCACWVTDSKYWHVHYGAVEPGSALEWNPDCPVHFRAE